MEIDGINHKNKPRSPINQISRAENKKPNRNKLKNSIMEMMKKIDTIFDEININDRVEKSLAEFSNWIFGISVGISALLIFQIKEFDFSQFYYSKMIYKGILIFSMINTLLIGYVKFLFHRRETIMNINYGLIQQLKFSSKINERTPDEIKAESNTAINDWVIAHNKIAKIGKLFNFTIWFTLITIIACGVLILIVI